MIVLGSKGLSTALHNQILKPIEKWRFPFSVRILCNHANYRLGRPHGHLNLYLPRGILKTVLINSVIPSLRYYRVFLITLHRQSKILYSCI